MLPSFPTFSHPKAFPFQVRRVGNSYTHFINESTNSVYSIQEIGCSLSLTIVWDADPYTLFHPRHSPSHDSFQALATLYSALGLGETNVVVPNGLRQCLSWNRRCCSSG